MKRLHNTILSDEFIVVLSKPKYLLKVQPHRHITYKDCEIAKKIIFILFGDEILFNLKSTKYTPYFLIAESI